MSRVSRITIFIGQCWVEPGIVSHAHGEIRHQIGDILKVAIGCSEGLYAFRCAIIRRISSEGIMEQTAIASRAKLETLYEWWDSVLNSAGGGCRT